MSSGLLALLDDIAAIVKVTAASLDDVAAQAIKASSKAAGVVIDDTAVTPKYVVGLSPARELPIVWNIAKGSIRNKILILLPAILLLGWIAPWSVQPLLGIGGAFLCYEGYEKVQHALHHYWYPSREAEVGQIESISPQQLERERTVGAIRTDFILSAEIMAISYAVVKDESVWLQISSLLAVAFIITAGVYGLVAVILKADDLGLHLASPEKSKAVRSIGRGLIHGMPKLLVVLSSVGTAAMLWVGGGIIIHSVPPLHHLVESLVEKSGTSGVLAWCVEATISLIFALVVGCALLTVVSQVSAFRNRAQKINAS